jgi:hypothetical protein
LKPLVLRIYIDTYLLPGSLRMRSDIFRMNWGTARTLGNIEVFIELYLAVNSNLRWRPWFKFFSVNCLLNFPSFNICRLDYLVIWIFNVKLSRFLWLVMRFLLGLMRNSPDVFCLRLPWSIFFERDWSLTFLWSVRRLLFFWFVWIDILHHIQKLLRNKLWCIFISSLVLNLDASTIVASQVVIKHFEIYLQELRWSLLWPRFRSMF